MKIKELKKQLEYLTSNEFTGITDETNVLIGVPSPAGINLHLLTGLHAPPVVLAPDSPLVVSLHPQMTDNPIPLLEAGMLFTNRLTPKPEIQFFSLVGTPHTHTHKY